MCYGDITRYSCGHEARSYSHICPDGFDANLQVVLSHRPIGRRILRRRLCIDCEDIRLAEQIVENNDRPRQEERAKALLEFLRGERPWPRPDYEVRSILSHAFQEGRRLHPFLNRGNDSELNSYQAVVANAFPETGTAMFQEMLDRQALIDETGVFLAIDLEYRLAPIMARAEAQRARRLIASREENAHREANHTIRAQRAQAIRDEQDRRLEQTTRLRERPRELLMALYHPESLEDLIDAIGVDEVALLREVDRVNAGRVQEIARLRVQIRAVLRILNVREEENHDAERRLNQALTFIREALVDGYQLYQQLVIRPGAGLTEWMRARTQGPSSQQFAIRWRQLNELRAQIIQELWDGSQNMGAVAPREPVVQQDTPDLDQPGMYESDDDWLLNFDDWCTDNNDSNNNNNNGMAVTPDAETNLRRDINGWFQHLRSSESQTRLAWIPFAESYRDAIQAGDRCQYEYVPVGDGALAQQPLSFRHWCLAEADPAEIRVSPINYTFINLLQGYANYLRRSESLCDLAAFQNERQARVRNMRAFLELIPGAPLSRVLMGTELIVDTPSTRRMLTDVRRLCRIGPTTNSNYIQRQLDIARLGNLHNEAVAVRAGYIPEFRIEREERERVSRQSEGRSRQQREEMPRLEREEPADGEEGERNVGHAIPLLREIPAGRRSAVERLDVHYLSVQDLDDDLGGPAGRNYNEWQTASAESRAQTRAERDESNDESDDDQGQ